MHHSELKHHQNEVKIILKNKKEQKSSHKSLLYAAITGLITAFISGGSIPYFYIFTQRLSLAGIEGIIVYAIIGLCGGTYMSTIQKNLNTKITFIICVILGSTLPIITTGYIIPALGYQYSYLFLLSSGFSGVLLSLTLKNLKASITLFLLGLGGPIVTFGICYWVILPIQNSIVPYWGWIEDFTFISFNSIYSIWMSFAYFLIHADNQKKLPERSFKAVWKKLDWTRSQRV